MSRRTALLTGRLGQSQSRSTSQPIGVDADGRWQRAAILEFEAIDQLGPLAKAVFDNSPRPIAAAQVCASYRLRFSPWHPTWNPDRKLDWKDPAIDQKFADYLRAEYKRHEGIDPVETALITSNAKRPSRIRS